MFKLVTFCLAVLAPVSAFIISSPGLQRYSPYQDCVFEWRISRPVMSFSFLNQSSSLNLGRIVIHNETSAIHLVIQSVQLYDAGNYTLVVNFFGGSTPTVDSTACLFVHGSVGPVILTRTVGSYEINEGGALTFVCNGTTTSQPSQYRQNVVYSYYTSAYPNYDYFVRRNDGSVEAGDRFKLIDNQTLRIYPVSHDDNGWVGCRGCDFFGYSCNHNDLFISVDSTRNDKPTLKSVYPPSRRSSAVSGESVTFRVNYYAFPAMSGVFWSFSTSESGPFSPSSWISSYTNAFTTYAQLSFTFSSSNQYGFYMCNISNILGTLSTTFQLSSPGPPNRPLLVQLFVTQTSVNLQWNSGWDNGRQQYFRIQLNDRQQNTTIQQIDRLQTDFNYSNSPYSTSDSQNSHPIFYYYHYSIYSYYYNYFNYTYVVNFTTDVYPDTEYEVLLWSVNALGSSEVVQLLARTPERSKIKLIVSQDSISIAGNSSFIKFSIDGGMASYLTIQCYELNSMKFVESTSTLTTATRQVNMTVPVGTKYRFNFRLFNNSDVLDYQTIQIPTEATTSTSYSIIQPTARTVASSLSTPCPTGDTASYCGGIQAWQCYNYKSICCARCPSYYNASRTGCEYGDTVDWCVSFVQTYKDCQRPEVASQCCLTCPKFPAPTTTTMKTPIIFDSSTPCITGDTASYCSTIQSYSCYFYNEICCASCPKFYNASNVGCEYGDRVSWCTFYVGSQKDCQRPEVAQFCCMTCRKYSN